jgi:lysocardiolipin and lysophospholipid acyltransferase
MIINVSKIVHVAKHVLVTLVLYATSTLGVCYMLFPLLPLLFVNRRLFHALSDAGLSIWLGLSVFLLEKVCSIRVHFHLSKTNRIPLSARQSGIILMNHRTRMDWLFYFCILSRLGQLGRIKIILKDVLKKVPGPGWAMQVGLFVFIRRRWEIDQKIFSKFINYFKFIEKSINVSYIFFYFQ